MPVSEYTKQRDVALMSFEVDRYKEFVARWNKEQAEQLEKYDDEVIFAAMCKLIVDSVYLPKSGREYAKKWLKDHNFSEEIY